jgi:predicted phosphodiesterase
MPSCTKNEKGRNRETKRKHQEPSLIQPFQEILSGYSELYPGPDELVIPKMYRDIAFVADPHFPFCHVDAVSFFFAWLEKRKHQALVVLGDLYDMLAHSKFPKGFLYTPQQEIEIARKLAEVFFATVRRIAPKIDIFLMVGNHDERPIRKIERSCPEAEVFVRDGLRPYFEFPSVQSVLDAQQVLVINHEVHGGISCHHGYATQIGKHQDDFVSNTVFGHTHRAWTYARRMRGRSLFEMSCPMLGDPRAKGLAWQNTRITRWTPGVAEIDSDGPRTILV